MTPKKYLQQVRIILDHLEKTQLPAVEKAADLIGQALTNKGCVFCAEIGHGTQGDFINRAGGLAAVQKFSFNLDISDKVPQCYAERPRAAAFERDLETIRFAVKASNLRAGDIILVSSVSGRNRGPIELALACRNLGVKTIGFTAMKYSDSVASLHPSGKKLYEVVDVVIDIGAPFGDAAVDIPGFDIKTMPVSGVAMDVAGWLIFGRTMEKMAEKKMPPTVYMSLNRQGGDDDYRVKSAQYEKKGF